MYPDQSPVSPVGGSRTITRDGLRAWSSLTSIPMRASPLALKLSMNTSDTCASRMTRARPSGRRVSIVTDSLLRANELFMAWRFQGRSG